MSKMKAVLAGVFVILFFAVFFAWRFFTSPQYSLMQVRKAVEQRDAARFEKYVDLEGIIRRAGNQLSSQWSAGLAQELGGLGGLDPGMVNGIMTAFGSAMIEPTVKQTREAALSFIETGRTTPIQTIPGDALDIASDLRIESVPIFETQGKMATIDLNLLAQGEPVRVRMFLRDLGRYWQIAEIDQAAKTAQDILAAYVRGERKRIETQRKDNPDRVVDIPGLGDNSKRLEMSYIPSGKFMMGSPADEEGRGDDEGRHRVYITRPFWLGKHEITNGQFNAFVKATGYVTAAEKEGSGFGWDAQKRSFGEIKGISWRNPGFPWDPEGKAAFDAWYKPDVPWNPEKESWFNLPVVMVSWFDATAFCEWLSGISGEKFGLPTEAQWEYASRAGSTGLYWWGDSTTQACQYANVFNQKNKGKWGMNWDGFPCDDGYEGLSPVGAFGANPFGLYDVTGNVWEWCADWYETNYYGSSPKEDPQGPANGAMRVYRGGSWCYYPEMCRLAYRFRDGPGIRCYLLGFRLAVSPAGQ